MRLDETGSPCPETLGEYYDMCLALGGDKCKAVSFLKEKIDSSPNGREEKVIAADIQMKTPAFTIPMRRVML